jgi:protein tyrosine/serine phosphatase
MRNKYLIKIYRTLGWVTVTLTVVVSATAYTSYVRITKNFYEVDPGRFYRSAQLTPDELQQTIDKYGIKTVISLRGAPENAYWYQPEIELLKRNHVTFKSYWLSMDNFPDKDDVTGILHDLKTAEKPILVHCKAGADRTGLVSALYVHEVMGMSKEIALQQLTFRYWHVPAIHPAMSAFIEQYGGPTWLETYDPCRYQQYSDKDTRCSPNESSETEKR